MGLIGTAALLRTIWTTGELGLTTKLSPETIIAIHVIVIKAEDREENQAREEQSNDPLGHLFYILQSAFDKLFY